MGISVQSYAADSKVERKLPIRRKKAPKGKVIRVSNLVYDVLNRSRGKKSWDNFMRKMLGLEDRNGKSQALIEGVLDIATGRFYLKDENSWNDAETRAYESAIIATAKAGLKVVPRPRRMREIP